MMKGLLHCGAAVLVAAAFSLGLRAGDKGLMESQYAWPEVAASFVAGADWFPLPAYTDRAGWDRLFGPDAEAVIRRGEKLLEHRWTHIPATAYLAFEREGDRTAMERIEGANRGAFIGLILAELAEGKGRFIDQLLDGAWFASEQTSWVLSAHQPSQRTKRALPDGREHIIDLAGGRFGAIMALAWHFFRAEFDKVDPSVSAAMERAVKRNILDPYLDEDEFRAHWWMGRGNKEGILNNWTPWCVSDVTLAFLLMEKDQERLDRALGYSMYAVDRFLDYIQKDGACEEGPGYWNAAAGKTFDLLQMLYDASGGAFDLTSEPRIRRYGEFITRSYIGNGWVVNFADGAAKASSPAGLIWNYGHQLRSRELEDFGLYSMADRRKGCFRAPGFVGNDAYRAVESVRFNADIHAAVDSLNARVAASSLDEVLAGLRAAVPATTWYPETELCYLRNASGWFLGAKGGYNNESHNHNDIGTCILFIRDTPVLVDAGVGTYTRETFGAGRYEIWSMQCDWHNLPMPGGVPQLFGAGFRARNVACDERKGTFSLDLTGAYPEMADLRSLTRSYRLAMKDTPSLAITDSYHLDRRHGPDIEHFLVQGEVILPGGTFQGRKVEEGSLVIVCADGLAVRMTYPRTLHASVEVRKLDDPRFSSVWGPSLRRISLTSAPDAPLKGTYTIRVAEWK